MCEQYANTHDNVRYHRLPQNSGVAFARNFGALHATSEFIAFLDADDAFEPDALAGVSACFYFRPSLHVVRLRLTPVNLSNRYAAHPEFERAWKHMAMTCGGNIAFRRSFFMACGGFPTDELFREFGGEDGALGIATTRLTQIGTLFDHAGVLHYCRDGMHAERLLDAVLFDKKPANITDEHLAKAEQITERIVARVQAIQLAETQTGVLSLNLISE
ncbi:glycosyltransferase [Moraxella caviae]|uniref:glycosyltransferase n=1 Tax=Moraxella caviae TaxID=34060 RepID=UPI001F5E4685|nr:glycosyltransferase family A protein [Moraxella caviae]